jgi:hypothetical protein
MGYPIMVGLPGPSAQWGAVRGLMAASQKNDVSVDNEDNSHDNFNALWAKALTLAEAGQFTHFAMLHSDVFPEDCWVDMLVDEMDKAQVTFISSPVAIKDIRGVMSCGIGDPANPWSPKRRITARELNRLPMTFGAADFGYPGELLLHNNGCWVADLRDKRFYECDEAGDLKACFQFPKRICRDPATRFWRPQGESEDWYFSRMIHGLGITSAITRRCKIKHRGPVEFANWGAWGEYEQDDDTRPYWDKDFKPAVTDAQMRVAERMRFAG